MAQGIPPFLQINRRPRRTMERRVGDEFESPYAAAESAPTPKRLAPAVAVPETPEAVPPPEAAPVVAPEAVEVSPAERRRLGPAPLQRNARGETVGRPEYDDTGDRLADLTNYDRQLESERNPKDRDGRWWTTLKETVAGFAEGGLMGAARRGLRGLAAPNVNERRDRDRERARVHGEMGVEQKNRDWHAKLAETQADIELKKANTEYTRKRPELEAERNDVRADIAREGNETRKAIAGMNDSTRRSEGEANRGLKRELGLASIGQRREASANNLKYREKKDTADRAQRAAQHGDRMELGRANLAERVASRISTEAARKVTQGQAATRIKISLARAKAWAEKEGAAWDDFVDALDENGVEITDK